MFIMQSFHFPCCFNEIRSSIPWCLSAFFIQLEYPNVLVTTSFLSCCCVVVIFQCKFITLDNLLFTPPNFRQRCTVFVIFCHLSSMVVSSMLGLTSFLQRLFGLKEILLPCRSFMLGSTDVTLLNDVTWDR